jgi:hypothetical protein
MELRGSDITNKPPRNTTTEVVMRMANRGVFHFETRVRGLLCALRGGELYRRHCAGGAAQEGRASRGWSFRRGLNPALP